MPEHPPAHDTPRLRLTQRALRVPHPLEEPHVRRGERRAVRSLYIHVPFCFHKCHYCDFYSIVDTRDRQEPFARRLVRELEALAPFAEGAPLRTIFVGGGTPSLMREPLWRQILEVLGTRFDLSLIRSGGGEFTVECNPETVTPELMETLRAGGVDRVSLGAQSFNPQHLKTLERWHDPANVARAIELARSAGIARQSIDLIFGIPGQTLADWESDLAAALALGTEHLSCYNLTYEPNTAMTRRLELGQFTPADEDVELAMFESTLRLVRAAGMDRYEVSNFCKPGCESRHNLAYWVQDSWLAAGPSASGFVGGWRWKNSPRLDDYLDEPGALAPVAERESPDERRLLTETVMTGLRLAAGLDRGAVRTFARRVGANVGAFESETAALVRRGLLTDDAARLRATDAGFLVLNSVVLELVEALETPL